MNADEREARAFSHFYERNGGPGAPRPTAHDYPLHHSLAPHIQTVCNTPVSLAVTVCHFILYTFLVSLAVTVCHSYHASVTGPTTYRTTYLLFAPNSCGARPEHKLYTAGFIVVRSSAASIDWIEAALEINARQQASGTGWGVTNEQPALREVSGAGC